MDISIEVNNEERCVKDAYPNPNGVAQHSEFPASTNLDKSEAENKSESDNVIVLNSSSEAEILEESEGNNMIEAQLSHKEDGGMEAETAKDTEEASPADDTCVPMDIDEELTEKIPEIKTFTKNDEDVIQECSDEINLEDQNTEKETQETVSTIISAQLPENSDTVRIEKAEASERETLESIAVEDITGEEMQQDPINSTESVTSAVIELLDDDENDKTDDLNVQATAPEKMDIDKNENEETATVNVNHDLTKCNNKEKDESSIFVEDTTNKQGLIDSISDEDNPKQALGINTNIRHLINEKIKKVMDEEDSVFYGKECINYECEQKCKNFYKAPLFTLNFFKIPRKLNKNQFICDECYNKAVLKYEELTGALIDHQALLYQDIPKRQDFVEILDSSDEEEKDGNLEGNGDFQKETLDFLNKELDTTICEILQRVEIDNQIGWTKSILNNKLKKLEDDTEFISNSLKNLQKSADHMHTSLYQCSKSKIKELLPLDLNTGRPYANETEFTIPPAGELAFPSIEINGSYFAVKNKAIASWLPCKVIEFMDITLSGQKSVKYYKIKFIKIKLPTVKCVSAKHMAYGDPPRVRLSIGTRIIALFDGSTLSRNKEKLPNFKSAFYPGIIAEPLQAYNNYRYLVFFDDGYAQYVFHKDIRVVCHASENVWDDVHPASREFIHNYLTQYQKNRPMVQVKKGQNMITESNGKWLYAKVVDIDASLVQMQFDGHNRTEWIYRGSTRLGPLFREKQTKRTMQITQIPRRSEPYVRYMQDEETGKNESYSTTNAERPRAVAKKSISKPDYQPPVKHLNNSTIFLEDDNKPKGKVVYYTAKKNMPPRSFINHDCNPKCLFLISHNLSSYSPLAKPLLSGWERQIFKSRLKKAVVYRAPCGRRLRNMDEMHRYLRLTKNVLNVDNFDFDCLIHCLAEYVIESSIVQNPDLSEGAENMIIPCINYYDNTMPPECTYSTKRIPTEGVNLNLDSNFLVGCDCEDNCLDKKKCSCWQLTLAGAKFGNPTSPSENIGYQFRRLPEAVPTGIYECNAKCKCSKSCLNRVVQHPLQMKLQVFKTSNRGWGIRCINDVPKGSFICIYAGHLLTEQNANEGGANSGDEYFAELDYIEVVERLKEGYESDVQEEIEESEEEYEEPIQENDSDEDFRSSAAINKSASINTRLRARRSTKDFSDSKHDEDKSKKTNDEDDEEERQVINFEPNTSLDNAENTVTKYRSIRKYYGKNEFCYVMDAKKTGNIGRYFNHSCSPNLFVQNVFVDTHDLRFPWVAFFALTHIRAGTELTWNYNYEVGIVPGKVLYCECGAPNCRGRLL